MNNIFVKDRRVTPALRLRPLQPYVSAALRPERKRVRNGHINRSGGVQIQLSKIR